MVEFIKRAASWLILLVSSKKTVTSVDSVPHMAAAAPAVPDKGARKTPNITKHPPLVSAKERAAEVSAMGRWYFRETILDDLAAYFRLLKKMKKIDKQAYSYCSAVGGVMCNYSRHGRDIKILSTQLDWGCPSVGAAVFCCDPEGEERLSPAYMHFTELRRLPYNVEPAGGRVFGVTLVYWPTKGREIAYPYGGKCYLALADDMKTGRVLMEYSTVGQVIRHKDARSRSRGVRVTTVYRTQWDIPEWVKVWASDPHHAKELGNTAHERMTTAFILVVNRMMSAQTDLRIRVEKDGAAAAFCIDLLRTPYFFADRDATVLVNGKRKPIFHIVRAHKRVLADGRETTVKSHTKGLRRFDWNGYKVNITLPGLHHGEMYDGGPIAEEYGDDEKGPKPGATITHPEFAKMVEKLTNV